VIRRVGSAGLKAVPTGIEHGTVTVVVDGVPFEVTTLRQDVETFGRRARVVFGRSWALDAQRRDFTINALFLARDGTLYDYVGGQDDLAHRRVRFIGDPATRIAEDYLRILRFFRFHASYGEGPPDPAGLTEAIRARDRIASLSRERVRMELMKLLLAPRAEPTLVVMALAGILGPVLGGVPQVPGFGRMVAVETAAGLAPDACRRLAALAVLVREDADRLVDRLRLSNAETECLISMAQQWWRVSPDLGEPALRALLYRLGEDEFINRVSLAWSRSRAAVPDSHWLAALRLPQRWTPPVLPIKAAALIARGLARGPALGRALAFAEDAWVLADFPTDRAALDKLADAAVERVKQEKPGSKAPGLS
jgi:poly(A) polymerase